MDTIARGSLGASVLVLGALLLAVLRQPLLLKLALRGPTRRPVQTSLVLIGLALSTIVIGTALNTGDTISHTVRSLVASGVGRADEVVLALPRDQRRSPTEYVTAMLNGTLLTGLGSYFPEEQAARLAADVSADDRLAGLTPAIGEQATAVNRAREVLAAQIRLLALPVDFPPVFGSLVSPTGESLALTDLRPGELLANTEAATLLSAEPGDVLEVRTRDGTFALTLRAIAQTTSLSGAQPTLFVPLSHYQAQVHRQGWINQILVANRGEAATSVRLSAEVTAALRLALVDRDAAARLFRLLHDGGGREEVASLARVADGRQREKLEALARVLGQPEASDDFLVLATDPDVERRLFSVAIRLASASRGSFASLPELSPLRVLEVKQASQDQADRWGGALTSVFLILGLFSLATGGLLVYLIFLTLAGERRTELGITRALGARRRDVIRTFLLEGGLYVLVASGVGLVLAAAIAVGMTALGDAALSQYGLRLQPHLEPRSLVAAYCLGLIITFASVTFSAWRISHLSPVAAIRNLPDPPDRRHPARTVLPGVFLASAGLAATWFGINSGLGPPQAGGVALSLVGGALIGRLGLSRLGLKPGPRDRLAYSASGLGLLAYWLAPNEWQAPGLVQPAARSLDLLFLAGLSMVLGAVWLAMYNLDTLMRPLVAGTARLKTLGLCLRLAVHNPLRHRFRSGLTVAMFGLVILNMVVAGVLLTATHRAYSDPEALSGGFDIRVDVGRSAELPSLSDAIENATSFRASDFTAIGRLQSRPGQVLELGEGARSWRPYPLQELDAGFVDGLRSPLAGRAAGFSSDADVWRAVVEQPGVAVVGGSAADAPRGDQSAGSGFRFAHPPQSGSRFAPIEVWIRDDRGGRAVKLTVIGVLDPRLSFGAGLYTSAATLGPAAAPAPQASRYYLKSRPGADPSTLALAFNTDLADRGLSAIALGEEVRRLQSVRTLLNQLLQAFFAVGLLAGIAALGLISMRNVVERHQEVGILRALGVRRHMVRLSLLLETSLLAVLGIGLGVGLGLALARRIVAALEKQYPEIVFSIPWEQLGAISLGAYLCAILLAAVPLWQIGRVRPAEALKYE